MSARITHLFASLVLAVSLVSVGCVVDDGGHRVADGGAISSSPDAANYATKAFPLKDLTTGLAAACTPVTGDDNCNAEGPGGQKLFCAADHLCYFAKADGGCTYPQLGGGTKTCVYTACAKDADCALANPDPDHLTGTCIFTVQSSVSDEGGECGFFYKDCSAAAGTPCQVDGFLTCANNVCTCSVSSDLSKAVTEVCDNVDNNCNGQTDETFSLGAACDGADADQCKHGTLQCSQDGLSTVCTNETVQNIAETCNGVDDDCDNAIDEDFPTLGQACDGADADQCKNGVLVCSNDGKGVACEEVGKNVEEACNGVDDDCDGQTDEGCDDDKDGYCDASMAFASGAACQKGDCNDADKTIHPGATEMCNGVDDDCNAQTDEIFPLGQTCSDGLGVCKVSGTYNACAQDGLSAKCSVTADLSKAATEICDGVDNNCDGKTDEGCDDDNDGWCDASMAFASGAACQKGDCNDASVGINGAATEICDGVDNNCDGKTDEGCDDDADGYCDATMLVGTGAACKGSAGKGTDCDDTKADVHPDQEEVCSTSYDDNCDGLIDLKADGKTPVCNACFSAVTIACGDVVEIDMAKNANAFNAINSYACWSQLGTPKTLKSVFDAPEVVVVPDAPAGTKFSLKIVSSDKPVLATMLHGSCQADAGTKAVTPYNAGAGLTGTCADYTIGGAVSGGVVGQDFAALDALSATKVKVRFTCVTTP
ncbi:putative metal-binding motif-containing protein [Candidatus Uhrbacteria bacterium]|nr:putative metal-binding motif-containing protein [Candidatus Uhrbacteria bacterium]